MIFITLLAILILVQTEASRVPTTVSDVLPTDTTFSIEVIPTTPYPQKGDDLTADIASTFQPDDYDSNYDINATTALGTTGTEFHETSTTISPEIEATTFYESNTRVFPKFDTTVFPDTSAAAVPKIDSIKLIETKHDTVPQSKCPNFGGRQIAGDVVKCQCQGHEILVDGKCQMYDGVTVIPAEHQWDFTREANVTDYNVIIQDVNCDPTKHQYMTFSKGKFRLRPRGDVVLLKEAGDLHGQRISNYCILHHLDDDGDLTYTLKACIPIPSVPRCCPFGYVMKEGKCQDADTPYVLEPPISAQPFSTSIPSWTNITNYYNPIKCEFDPLITIPLGHKHSNLVSLANGVENGWRPIQRRVYNKCPDYCVDGIQKSDGSVDYFTSFCHSDPEEIHRKACAKGACLRKCCKYGHSRDMNGHSCVPDHNSTFTPHTYADLSIVIGRPLCTPVSKVEEKFSVDRTSGYLILKDRKFEPSKFCVDTFLDNDNREQGALACLTEISFWLKVRLYLFPICNVISLIFLMIIIISHLLVPKLLANGGLHQLCHVIALSIAYITSFSVNVFRNFFSTEVCVNIAIAMQFGFLTTFFWLNVMCLEIWRKIRRLKNYRPCKSYPNRFYMIYGWGIPLCICVITILMQKYAPDNVWGVIKPYIGVSSCWFFEDKALLVYFYGPSAALFIANSVFLALTYIDYKVMLRDYKETMNDLKDKKNMSSSMPSRQITDHVHDFHQKLKIFILMATCWVTEVLSWKIPPVELWSLTDTLNSLQGFFLFIILLSNSNKRKHLEEKYPNSFRWLTQSSKLTKNMQRWIQNSIKVSLTPVSSFASSISRQFSRSTVISRLTSSSTSFNLNSPSPSSEVSSSVTVDDPEKGVIVLSHSSLQSSNSTEGYTQPSSPRSTSMEGLPDSSC